MRAKNSRFWGGFPSLDTLVITLIFLKTLKRVQSLAVYGSQPIS